MVRLTLPHLAGLIRWAELKRRKARKPMLIYCRHDRFTIGSMAVLTSENSLVGIVGEQGFIPGPAVEEFWKTHHEQIQKQIRLGNIRDKEVSKISRSDLGGEGT